MSKIAYRRVYPENIKKYLVASGIGIPLIFGIFYWLVLMGDISITGYSGDITCAGTELEPCYAYINFTANKDVYIYPTNDTTWSFNTSTQMKSIIMQRSWGNSWRTIDLNKTYTKDVKYAIKFSMGQNYQLRFIGYKYNIDDTVKWGFANIDPVWNGYTSNDFLPTLIENYADLTFGRARFVLKNPTNFDISDNLVKLIDFNILKTFGTDTNDLTISIEKTRLISNKIIDYSTSCGFPYYHTSPNGTIESSPNCTTVVSGWHWDNKTENYFDPYLYYDFKTDSRVKYFDLTLKKKTDYIVLIEANWDAKLGEQNRDWRIKLNISNVVFEKKEWQWWNNSFGKMKSIPIQWNSPSADWKGRMENYQLFINVTYDSDMMSDFSDLRFVNNSDNTAIDFWIENYTAVSADVWLEIPKLINTTNTTIDMYYKNSTIINGIGSGTDTFIFFDNFDGVELNTSKYINNTVFPVSQSKINFNTGTSYMASRLIFSNPLKFKTRIYKEDAGSYYFFGLTNNPNAFVGNNVGFQVGTDEKIYYESKVSGYDENQDATNLVVNTWFKFQFNWNSTAIDYFKNDVLRSTHTAQVPTIALNVSVDANQVGNAYIDWVLLANKTSIEPAYSFGEEQSPPAPAIGTSTSLWLNGTAGNSSNIYSSAVNITAIMNTTGISFIIAKNGTTIGTGVSPLKIVQNISELTNATYNITAYWNGNATHTASSKSYNLYVNKGASLLWRNQTTNDTDNIINPGEFIILAAQGYSLDNANYTGGLDFAWLETNETGTWKNTTHMFHFNESIRWIGNLTYTGVAQYPSDMATDGDYIYVATHQGYFIKINIKSGNFTLDKVSDDFGETKWSVAYWNGFLYSSTEVSVMNITYFNASTWASIKNYTNDNYGYADDLFVYGNHLYYIGNSKMVLRFNLTSTDFIWDSMLNYTDVFANGGRGLSTDGKYLYAVSSVIAGEVIRINITDDKFTSAGVLNLSASMNPVPYNLQDSAVIGNYLYIINEPSSSTNPSRLIQINITDGAFAFVQNMTYNHSYRFRNLLPLGDSLYAVGTCCGISPSYEQNTVIAQIDTSSFTQKQIYYQNDAVVQNPIQRPLIINNYLYTPNYLIVGQVNKFQIFDYLTNVWGWSNFTWTNPSVIGGTVVGWRIYYNDTSNNQNKTDINTFRIFTPIDTSTSLWLNNTAGNYSTIYGSQVNATAKSNVTGIPLTIAKNGTVMLTAYTSVFSFLNQSDLGNSTYNITAYFDGNSSHHGSSKSYWLYITRNDILIDLYLNGSKNTNINAMNRSALNITIVFNVSGTAYIDSNETGWVIVSGGNPFTNISTINGLIGSQLNFTGYNAVGNSTFSSKTQYVTIKEPYPVIQFISQNPPDISAYNIFISNFVNITYNITDFTSKIANLYYKTNTTTSDISSYVNGTAQTGYFMIENKTNATSFWNFYGQDNEVYPATYNINETFLEDTIHVAYNLNSTNSYIKTELFNVSATKTYSFLELMARNGTVTSAALRIYYCNSSYTGNPAISNKCASIWTIDSNIPYNHSHPLYSSHFIIPFAINNSEINGIKITDISYFLLRGPLGAGSWNQYYIPTVSRTSAVQYTSNAGSTWANIVGTTDLHLHQYDGTDTFRYYVCANTSIGNSTCSAVRTDLINLTGIPPDAPFVYSPIEGIYGGTMNVLINYTSSVSPNDYNITKYNITLNNPDGSYNLTITANNGLNLGYAWNVSSIISGQYVIRVFAWDNVSQSSFGQSENFTIVNISISVKMPETKIFSIEDTVATSEFPNMAWTNDSDVIKRFNWTGISGGTNITGGVGNVNSPRYAFYKFNVSNTSYFDNATLNLYRINTSWATWQNCELNVGAGPAHYGCPTELYYSLNQTWTERTLFWNSMPVWDIYPIDKRNITTSYPQWNWWDVTGHVKSILMNATFMLKIPMTNTGQKAMNFSGGNPANTSIFNSSTWPYVSLKVTKYQINETSCSYSTTCYQNGTFTPKGQNDNQWMFNVTNIGETFNVSAYWSPALPSCMNHYLSINRTFERLADFNVTNSTSIRLLTNFAVGTNQTYWGFFELNNCTAGATLNSTLVFASTYGS